MMTSMDRNSLTALLTALAIVPLYFKEPSQAASEKWEFGYLAYQPAKSEKEGSLVQNSDGSLNLVHRGDTGPWILTRVRVRPLAEGELVKSRDIDEEEFAPNLVGRRLAESEAYAFYLKEITRMEKEGWTPFAAHPTDELGKNTIYYRRRVE
jgi:hypothetical protein